MKILRDIKNNRQIILVTQNANIPVLGDAKQVFVLEASNEELLRIFQSTKSLFYDELPVSTAKFS